VCTLNAFTRLHELIIRIRTSIMTLSLILATRQQRTFPDPSKPHSQVSTERCGRNWPELPEDRHHSQRGIVRIGVPTLSVLAMNRHLTTRAARISHDNPTDAHPLLHPDFLENFATDAPFYLEYTGNKEPDCYRAAISNYGPKPEVKKIYLSTASLIIVPRLLLKQWEAEIKKHFRKDALKYIVVGADLPSRDEVMGCDVSKFHCPDVNSLLIAQSLSQIVLITDDR
jgi:hypothetical protein